MSNLNLRYAYPSYFQHSPQQQNLTFAHLSQAENYQQHSCFFDGQAKNPMLLAKALVTLSHIIRADFSPRPKPVYDPIVTAGQQQLRFEGLMMHYQVIFLHKEQRMLTLMTRF